MSIQKLLQSALFVFIFVTSLSAYGQVVYKTQFVEDANVKVYVTQYKQEADVVVFKTPFIHNADGNSGCWYFTPYQGEANKRIFFMPSKDNSNLIIYWTNNKDEAGWQNKKKKYLMK